MSDRAPARAGERREGGRVEGVLDGSATLLREASREDLRTWDQHAVDAPGGHILQSLAWGEHRARIGLRIRHLVFGDGRPLLVLDRPWPLIGGSAAYLSRGPSVDEPAERIAARVDAVARWLGDQGVDVTAADPEVPEATGFGELLDARGWHRIEELWQSRHRMTRPIREGEDEAAALGEIAKSTRQRIRAAEREGIVVVRFDARSGLTDAVDRPGASRDGAEGGRGGGDGDPGEGFVRPSEPLEVALQRFYGWLVATGERRGFEVGTPAEHVAWWRAAAGAGHLVYLESHAPDGEPLGGLVLYRHGDRLSTASSADRAETRRAHPGALHLLRWRALQLAIREGRRELDMGGVDVPGARREPREGDPMYGLYQHKRAFGAEWLALAGAHERVARPRRYLIGRASARLARLAGRSA
ncbi:MAG TPA: GNAT family N-acetyltransferase [Candidatus Dormibacteraeota bacterium]|nr:GNAT family N-acetyltransferase [Candidatus Dormibacteraeota bacterium]